MLALQVIPDRFTEQEKIAIDAVSTNKTLEPFIRRPTRGITLKEDTFATLRLVAGAGGNNIKLVDAGAKAKNGGGFLEIDGKRATDVYSNFLLQQVNEDRAEKQQVLETFGEPYIFLFGERPRIMGFSGILLNSQDFNWEAEWWYNYENYLRGTRCVENDARVFLSFDNTLISGYIIAASASKNSQERNWVNFQFQMFITSYTNFSDIGNPYAQPGWFAQDVPENWLFKAGDIDPTEFRPVLLDNFGRVQISGTGGTVSQSTGKVEMPSLEEGMTNNLAQVTKAWTAIRSVVNGVITNESGVPDSSYVRVPFGFEGSLEFGGTGNFSNSNDVQIATIDFSKVRVTYTTYDQNTDEYVGVGDHYGSSNPKSTLIKDLGLTNFKVDLQYNQQLVEEARRQWGSAPYNVYIPVTQLADLSEFIVSGEAGLLAVNAATALISAGGTVGAAITSAKNFANSLPNPPSIPKE